MQKEMNCWVILDDDKNIMTSGIAGGGSNDYPLTYTTRAVARELGGKEPVKCKIIVEEW